MTVPDRLPTVMEVQFAVSTGNAGAATVCATATVPAGGPRTLQILVPGGTYNRWYWNPTFDPGQFSYVRAAARRGLATLNVDPLGRGASSRPAAADVGVQQQAAAFEQIIRCVRSDGLGGRQWERIVLVGHSLGSAVIITLLDRLPAVDAAVITGFTRRRFRGSGGLAGLTRPANDDPRFADASYSGYTTMPPGSRPYFYHLPSASAGMLLADEDHRDVTSARELSDLEYDWERNVTCAKAPVLVAVGERDFTYHWDNESDFAASQRGYYPDAPSVTTLVAPDTGHNLALHGDGPLATQAILDWIEPRTTLPGHLKARN